MFLKADARYELRGGEQLHFADLECSYIMGDSSKSAEDKHEVSYYVAMILSVRIRFVMFTRS